MAVYNFSDVTVAGEFPYKGIGLVSLAAFAFAYTVAGRRRVYALGVALVAGFVYLASVPKSIPGDTGGILDYNANLTP